MNRKEMSIVLLLLLLFLAAMFGAILAPAQTLEQQEVEIQNVCPNHYHYHPTDKQATAAFKRCSKEKNGCRYVDLLYTVWYPLRRDGIKENDWLMDGQCHSDALMGPHKDESNPKIKPKLPK